MKGEYFKTMGLDLGERRIGIALSDIMGIIANGYQSYTRTSLQSDIQHIIKIVQENNVKVIVLGLPLNMDGTEGEAVRKVKFFANELRKHTDIKIDFYDERLTTSTAQKMLISADVSRAKRKMVVDKIAATIILQDYLNTH